MGEPENEELTDLEALLLTLLGDGDASIEELAFEVEAALGKGPGEKSH